MRLRFILPFILCTGFLHAQDIKTIQLDSITITAVKGGFSVQDFIDLVKADTSFYRAFKNLKCYPYQSQGNLVVFNKASGEKASMHRKATQYVRDNSRWLVINEEKVQGPLRKKKKYNYYTAELFDYIFFATDTTPVANTGKSAPNKKNQDYEEKLKVLIFNPGAKVEGVPIISERMAIFDPDMVKYYDYKITSETYKDSIPCYVFRCTAKKDLGYFAKDKPVIKELVSYFDKKKFRIMSRSYLLSYSSALFDFNVQMDVALLPVKDKLIPGTIVYKGQWDIPFKKREIVNFNIHFSNYKVN